MGRWVTSKGRRIYIPDEGEENPYVKKTSAERATIRKNLEAGAKIVGTSEGTARQLADIEKADFWQKDNSNKEEDTKQKQIAENKKQADERNTTYLDNDISKEEQAYMNAKAIKISKNMPKEKQAELRKLKAAYNKDYKEEKAKRLASSGGKKQYRMDAADWEVRMDDLYSKYSKKFSVEPNAWLNYGEEGKAAYRQYKEAVNKVEPNKRKQYKYFRDRREF